MNEFESNLVDMLGYYSKEHANYFLFIYISYNKTSEIDFNTCLKDIFQKQ